MIWVLIVSELLVFGAGLLAFLGGVRAMDPPVAFAADQDHLNRVAGGAVNTIVLVASGYCAARAVNSTRHMRSWLGGGAMALGAVFLVVKWFEYAEKARLGIGLESSDFFYILLPSDRVSRDACGGGGVGDLCPAHALELAP